MSSFRVLCLALAILGSVAPLNLRAQQPGTLPPPTQSQSGYPDIRKEAADPTLFPNPEKVARDTARSPRNVSASGAGRRNGRGRRVGSRSNDELLGQADSDPLPVRVAYRRARTLAMERNPNLQTLLLEADRSDSDVEKRRYLHAYYDELYADVRRIDATPAMKSHLALLGQITEQRYNPKRRAVAGEEDLVNGREDRQGKIR